MKKREIILILVLIGITVFMAILLYNSRKQKNPQQTQQEEPLATTQEVVQEGNTTYNNREKVVADKQFGQFKVSNISVTEERGITTIRASVENSASTMQEEFPITIELKDEQNQTIQVVHAYVGRMQAGESRSIVASVNMDVTRIYDISFQK